MNVAFDIDGVLANFAGGFSGVLKDLYGLDVDPQPQHWNLSAWVDGLTHGMESAAWDAIFENRKYRHFWYDLKPLCSTGDIARINLLSRKNLVTFITNRRARDQHLDVADVTRNWLQRQGLLPWQNTFLAGRRDKGKQARHLGTHLAIEDNGENCLAYLDSGVGVAMLRRPYNEAVVKLVEARGGYIVDSVSEFLGMCFRFEAQQEEQISEPSTA